MNENNTKSDEATAKSDVDLLVSGQTINWHDIVTTCNCGRTIVLKPLFDWMVADCLCGRNIRLSDDKSRMIMDYNKVQVV